MNVPLSPFDLTGELKQVVEADDGVMARLELLRVRTALQKQVPVKLPTPQEAERDLRRLQTALEEQREGVVALLQELEALSTLLESLGQPAVVAALLRKLSPGEPPLLASLFEHCQRLEAVKLHLPPRCLATYTLAANEVASFERSFTMVLQQQLRQDEAQLEALCCLKPLTPCGEGALKMALRLLLGDDEGLWHGVHLL